MSLGLSAQVTLARTGKKGNEVGKRQELRVQTFSSLSKGQEFKPGGRDFAGGSDERNRKPRRAEVKVRSLKVWQARVLGVWWAMDTTLPLLRSPG